MNIVVTGSTGFVGHHVVAHLLAHGHRVRCVVRPDTDLARLPQGITPADTITHGAAHDTLCALEAEPADAVIHLASLVSASDEAEDVAPIVEAAVVFGAQIAHAAARGGVAGFVHAGTYWAHRSGTAAEEPVCLYAAAKLAFNRIAQFYAETSGMHVIELELTDTYGEGDTRGKFLDLVDRAARSGETLPASPGDQLVSLVHADDVAHAFATAAHLAAQTGHEGTYSIASDTPLVLRDIVDVYRASTGRAVSVEWGALPYRDRPIMQPYLHDRLPGWSPRVGLEDGLARVYGKGTR